MKPLRCAVALAALCIVSATCPGAAVATSHPERMTLRLGDLAPGYVVGGDSGCGIAIAGEGVPWALTRLFVAQSHVGCTTELVELWSPPGSGPRPDRIVSAAFAFGDAHAAAAEMRYPRWVVALVMGLERDSLVPLKTSVELGDETLAYRSGDAVAVLWRSGAVMGILLAEDPDAVAERAALELAAVQQQRILAPTPVLPSDYDDLEVRLDDPRVDIEVQWLDRDLPRRAKLPHLRLTFAEGASESLGQVRLDYGTEPYGSEVRLYLYRRAAWRRHAGTRFGRLIWHERCVRVERIAVPGGVAVIYAGHVRPPARCGDRRPDRFLAHVFVHDVVVSINPQESWSGREWGGAYDSRAGMRRVVRALRIRS